MDELFAALHVLVSVNALIDNGQDDPWGYMHWCIAAERGPTFQVLIHLVGETNEGLGYQMMTLAPPGRRCCCACTNCEFVYEYEIFYKRFTNSLDFIKFLFTYKY